MTHALPFEFMDQGFKRLTIDVPEDLHDAFLRKCFLASPRVSMKQRVLEFLSRETGRPMPKMVDRRKMTRAEREKSNRK